MAEGLNISFALDLLPMKPTTVKVHIADAVQSLSWYTCDPQQIDALQTQQWSADTVRLWSSVRQEIANWCLQALKTFGNFVGCLRQSQSIISAFDPEARALVHSMARDPGLVSETIGEKWNVAVSISKPE